MRTEIATQTAEVRTEDRRPRHAALDPDCRRAHRDCEPRDPAHPLDGRHRARDRRADLRYPAFSRIGGRRPVAWRPVLAHPAIGRAGAAAAWSTGQTRPTIRTVATAAPWLTEPRLSDPRRCASAGAELVKEVNAARCPRGAALESAPERAVAARRFRFRVAARPAAVARRPMGAAPSAPGPHQAGRRLLAAARYASPASSERWWGRHVVASCRPSCAAAASLTGSKLVDGESAARPAVARSGRRLPGRTVEDSGEQPNPAAVSPEASHLGSATTAT